MMTLDMFKQLFEYVGSKDPVYLPEKTKADLSYSFVSGLLKSMLEISFKGSKNMNAPFIGLTGGVTYNLPIAKIVNNELENIMKTEDNGQKIVYLNHSRLPNGDGCISTGQNVIAGHMQGEDVNC